MNNQRTRTRRSQLACPQCGKHQIGVRAIIAKENKTVERYRFCTACRHVFKTREQAVDDFAAQSTSEKTDALFRFSTKRFSTSVCTAMQVLL